MTLTDNQHQMLKALYDNRDSCCFDQGNLAYYCNWDTPIFLATITQLTKKGLMCEDYLGFYFITPEGEAFFSRRQPRH